MSVPVSAEYRTESRTKIAFHKHYLALLFLSLHWAIVLYINSSYLEQFVSQKTISLLYMVGAGLTIIAFFYAAPLLNRFGNTPLTITLTVVEFCTLIGMAFTGSTPIAITLFIIHQAVVPLILFNLDVFVEELIGTKEESTGGKRGFVLFIISITYALAAFSVGPLLGTGEPRFELAYLLSAFLLIPFFYITVTKFKDFIDPKYPHFKVFEGIAYCWKYKDIRNVFFAHLFLQLFFTWMVIYTPLYLATVIGFDWEKIGSILFVGLMAYVFLEYGIGLIADSYIGEKEMMALGFAIMAISTSWIVFLDSSSIMAWMVTMFMTRVGASLVETTTESYFFKHTRSKDINIIGIFRITQPLSYVGGAVLGATTLHYLPFELLFVILGILMIPGLFFAMALNDTK